MTDLVIIVPTRGRPGAVHPLVEAFQCTRTADSVLMFVVDEDDPQLDAYRDAIDSEQANGARVGYLVGAARNMAEALNGAAKLLIDGPKPPFALGFMGDDHRPRTTGWDTAYVEALRNLGTGLVYGNDLLQGERLPTQVAMTSDIVRALGWMTPPGLGHLFLDNWWRDLGQHAGCLRYLPEVIVEHRHPVAGKATWDDGYVRVNASEVYERDGKAYAEFVSSGGFTAAVAKVRELRG